MVSSDSVILVHVSSNCSSENLPMTWLPSQLRKQIEIPRSGVDLNIAFQSSAVFYFEFCIRLIRS